jgi:hypothetical protein
MASRLHRVNLHQVVLIDMLRMLMYNSFEDWGRRVEIAVSLLIVLQVSLMTISCCLDKGKWWRNYSRGVSFAKSKRNQGSCRVKGQVAYSQKQVSENHMSLKEAVQSEP